MDVDTSNAARNLYIAAGVALFVALTSWICCFVGPIGGIAMGIYARRQVRWYQALMEPQDFPSGAATFANVAGLVAIGLSVLELVVLLGLRFVD